MDFGRDVDTMLNVKQNQKQQEFESSSKYFVQNDLLLQDMTVVKRLYTKYTHLFAPI